ncbi:MAG: DUF1146 domain-containing protein [Anaerorhabdus sp.]
MSKIAEIAIYIISFILSMIALSSVNFEGIIRKGHSDKAQVLYILLSMALAYFVGSFLMKLIY